MEEKHIQLIASELTLNQNQVRAVAELLADGDPVRALALDGAGTGAGEQIAQMVHERVCDEASERGWRTGMRASPGQEGWAIEQQRQLFSLVPAERVGVRLTESCLMIPRKSVSFAIGLGPQMQADETPCDYCSKRKRCFWRTQANVERPTVSSTNSTR